MKNKKKVELDELSDYLWKIDEHLSSIGSSFDGKWGITQNQEQSEANFNLMKMVIIDAYEAKKFLLWNLSGSKYIDLADALSLLNELISYLEESLLSAMQTQDLINSETGRRTINPNNVTGSLAKLGIKQGVPFDCLVGACNTAYEKFSERLNSIANKVAGIFVKDQLNEQIEEYEGYEATLTDTERNILEALGKDTLKGAILLKKAGYDPTSSHYRGILSNLKKRNILGHNSKGYYNAL